MTTLSVAVLHCQESKPDKPLLRYSLNPLIHPDMGVNICVCHIGQDSIFQVQRYKLQEIIALGANAPQIYATTIIFQVQRYKLQGINTLSADPPQIYATRTQERKQVHKSDMAQAKKNIKDKLMDQISGLEPSDKDYICAQYNHSRSFGERILISIQLVINETNTNLKDKIH